MVEHPADDHEDQEVPGADPGSRQVTELLADLAGDLQARHDDPEREFDYTAGADIALAEAAKRGWTVISVRDDWSRVFVD